MPNLELSSFALLNFEGEVFDWRDQTGYQDAFEALAGHMPLGNVAAEGQIMRLFVHHALAAANPGIRIVDGERQISGLRICKTPDEIEILEKAIRISEAALSDVLAKVRVGMSEKDVEMMLTQALFTHGADRTRSTRLWSPRDNSAHAHGLARADYKIRGDALMFDFGAAWGGFCADITRTFFVGEASQEARDVYATVLAANPKARDITRPGITAHELDDAVISILEASPYRDRIRTKTGHGLGRQVHEEPYIMRGNHQVLEPGMVYTDEPGLYREGGFGVRIEDDVLVTGRLPLADELSARTDDRGIGSLVPVWPSDPSLTSAFQQRNCRLVVPKSPASSISCARREKKAQDLQNMNLERPRHTGMPRQR